jgi:hypothetical protein
MLSLQEPRRLGASLPARSFFQQLGPFALIQRPPEEQEGDASLLRTQLAPRGDMALTMASLLFQLEDLRAVTLPPLRSEDSLSVGRQLDCDLVLEHTTVSKRHAVLRWEAARAECTVQDVGSTNGTYVNGMFVARRTVRLRDGDLLAFGDVAFWYLLTGTLHTLLKQGPPKLGSHSG